MRSVFRTALLWLALSAAPLLVVAHAFVHPVADLSADHDCAVCGHGQHGGGPIPVVASLPAPVFVAVERVPVAAAEWLVILVRPAYASRAPPASIV